MTCLETDCCNCAQPAVTTRTTTSSTASTPEPDTTTTSSIPAMNPNTDTPNTIVLTVPPTVELRNGSNPREGNLFINGEPVCDDYWDMTDANVACRMYLG